MKKRVYKATKVKKLNLEKLKKEVEGKDIVFSVDVAKKDFMATILGQDREVIITIRWKHPSESQLLLDVMLKELRWNSLEVAMEPSGTYGDSLRMQFQKQGISVFRVSPKRCHDASEVFDGVVQRFAKCEVNQVFQCLKDKTWQHFCYIRCDIRIKRFWGN